MRGLALKRFEKCSLDEFEVPSDREESEAVDDDGSRADGEEVENVAGSVAQLARAGGGPTNLPTCRGNG